ncbi:Zn-dependent protease (includes SpoIVFB) [Tissierella praeacuta DSM 18095]|uniref:Zn-dependent protease (Includes SpoIVFB) n=1 Tax=Tissierella praeacuta DSM 18095 TaxID=1123404 RepID=A0A1M4SEL5_9FIRM|nr:site-2 protease family protein [Tissierella praeacuta]TCU72757.1 Zn-dependent protease [Tissierella praeacuta]SHE30605.1 Zn-dependent protease (includes SpoIVFB) [Tissierella praeacuta DSM 18095]SUP01349.1 Zn-dependent proteases [Tissierella praeacuta]
MNVIYNLPGLFIAIIFHELAHGLMAYWLGDDTAKNAGRLTLNPLKHLDLGGFLCLVIFKFGWAKPVPINPFNFQNRKKDTILVSLAGPLSNFIIAIIIVFVLSLNIITNAVFFKILFITLWYNIMLGIFNLLPFPPLDGSKIVASLLPNKIEYYFYKYERYLYMVLIVLIATNIIDKIMSPIIDVILNLLISIIG